MSEPSQPEPTPQGRRAAGVLTVVVALGLAMAAVGLRQTQPPPAGLEGQRVAPLSLPRIGLRPQPEVERVEVGAATGRPTLLHFWGPSCAPCVQEAPAIDALAREHDVWTVSAEDVVEIRAMMLTKGLTYPVLHDAAGAAHERFRVSAIPATFVLDGQGVVRRELRGPQPIETLREAMAAAAQKE